jgi:hypothetical protein
MFYPDTWFQRRPGGKVHGFRVDDTDDLLSVFPLRSDRLHSGEEKRSLLVEEPITINVLVDISFEEGAALHKCNELEFCHYVKQS